MSYEQKPGTGVFFPNQKENDKQPDLKGTITLPNGTKMNIAAWDQKSKNGNQYYSLKLSEINH